MIRFIVDASIVAKWFVLESGTPEAVALRNVTLLAPDVIVPECANILWKKVRRGEATPIQAHLAAETLERWGMALHASAPLVRAALSLSLDLDHPAYDCFYLALAAQEACPFVTADEKLVRKVAHADLAGVEILGLSEAANRVRAGLLT